MRQTAGVLAMVCAIALPGSVFAAQGGSAPQQGGGAQHGASGPHGGGGAPYGGGAQQGGGGQHGTMDGSSAQGQPAHGGGPTREAPAPSGASRKDMLHNASPHIVAVQTQLAAAREESQGIDRLASLSGGTLNPEYREHVGVFARSVGTDLTTARTHLEHLRTSADQLGIMNKVSGDFTSAEQALDQARRSVGQMEQASGDVNQLKNTNRDLGRQLQQAKDAVGRIEHAMK